MVSRVQSTECLNWNWLNLATCSNRREIIPGNGLFRSFFFIIENLFEWLQLIMTCIEKSFRKVFSVFYGCFQFNKHKLMVRVHFNSFTYIGRIIVHLAGIPPVPYQDIKCHQEIPFRDFIFRLVSSLKCVFINFQLESGLGVTAFL